MNVFIYAGPEVVQTSLTRTLAALKLVLVPNYTVQSITPQSLKSHPWSPNCALLLFPECHHLDLPDPRVVDNIRTYIEQGGRAIFLKALLRKSQTYLNAKGLHFTDRQQGPTGHLVLYPCGTPLERTVRRIQSTTTNRYFSVFASSRSVVDVLQPSTDTPLASYTDSGDSAHVPGVVCNVSRGKIAVWSHDMTEAKEPPSVDDDAEHVLALLKDTVVALGMNVVMETAVHRSIPRPKPQLLVSRPAARGIVAHVLDGLSIKTATDIGPVEFEDSNDRFRFSYQSPTVEQLLHDSDLYSQDDPTSWQPKHILVYPDGMLPADSSTPLFSLTEFFGKLEAPIPTSSTSWAIGDVVLYGETVTSTQTMLDRNPKLLSSLPTPIVSLASQQLTGRGRGSNIWLSPAGCLQFSVLLRLSLSDFPASKLVFIQYLFGLAVAEACRLDAVLGHVGDRVRLKWPNDIYVLTEDAMTGLESKKKIGGILVNTNFSSGMVDIVIGCGVNVLNEAPIMSLAQLVLNEERSVPTMEGTAAAILVTFQKMWTTFIANKGSFEPFMDLYLERWLHSDQPVTLTSTDPHLPVRIVGITSDHGLLRTLPERTPRSGGSGIEYIDLQPDGNSFDIMSGLIKTKT